MQSSKPTFEITNVGCRFFLGIEDPATGQIKVKKLNLAKLSYEIRTLPFIYDHLFAAIRFYMHDSSLNIKKGEYNIFSSGCVNFIGTNSVDMAFTGAHMLAMVLRENTGIPFRSFDLSIVFQSATVKLGYLVNIVKLAKMVYNAELNWNKKKKFSGLIVRFESGDTSNRYHITYTIYTTGVCLISGLKNMKDAETHYNVLCQMTEPFKVSPINPTTHQIAMRIDYHLPDFIKNGRPNVRFRKNRGDNDEEEADNEFELFDEEADDNEF